MDRHEEDQKGIDWNAAERAAIEEDGEGEYVPHDEAEAATGIPPENAPSTIRRKRGSTTPLIDTGVLRSSVSYRAEGG